MKHIIPNLVQSLSEFNWRSPRAINSFKTALGCLIGYAIVKFSSLQQSQWIIITILVIMSAQSTIGGLLIKSYMRFWGTLLGAAVAVFAYMIGGTNPWWIATSLFISTLMFSYLAGSSEDISAAGTLGVVTVVVILLNHPLHIGTASARLLEIVLGIIISLVIGRFIFPLRASDSLQDNIAQTLLDIKQHYQNCIDRVLHDKTNLPFSDIEEKIIHEFTQQRRLIHELDVEFGKRIELDCYQGILLGERKVFRCINLMLYSASASNVGRDIIKQLANFKPLHDEIINFLEHHAEALKTRVAPTQESTIMRHLMTLDSEIKAIAHEKAYEEIASVNSFVFSIHFLLDGLKELAEHIMTLYGKPLVQQ